MAIYRLPGEKAIKVVAQKKSKLTGGTKKNAESKGFILAPFSKDSAGPKILIQPDIFAATDKLPALNFAKQEKKEVTSHRPPKIKQTSRHEYIGYIKKIQAEIKEGRFKKVVAARVTKKKKPSDFEPVDFLEKLCQKYPAAFVSLVYTQQHGLWIGATPEILLKVDSGTFTTYSLAGTKANTPQNAKTDWGNKEKEEQHIVSKFVTAAFKKATPAKAIVTGPETIAAGNLLHLRTTFNYKAPHKIWPLVVSQLHPTPAVAGLPKKQSIQFIVDHEKADRSYYSGYLGPVNLDNQINLFVNLRCMQVLKNKLAIHVGCGVTIDSKPSAEWKESKMKTETLLSVLK